MLIKTHIIKTLEEVGGIDQDEHLVFSFARVFNIHNVLKMRLIAAKENIKPNIEVIRLAWHSSGSQDIVFLVGDSYAPIFEEGNREVIQENIRMYHFDQEMSHIFFPLPRTSQEFEKKKKMEFMVTNVTEEQEDDDDANAYEDKVYLILRKIYKLNSSFEPIHFFVDICCVSANEMIEPKPKTTSFAL